MKSWSSNSLRTMNHTDFYAFILEQMKTRTQNSSNFIQGEMMLHLCYIGQPENGL